jgi:negative regulator of sigma E activity
MLSDHGWVVACVKETEGDTMPAPITHDMAHLQRGYDLITVDRPCCCNESLQVEEDETDAFRQSRRRWLEELVG